MEGDCDTLLSVLQLKAVLEMGYDQVNIVGNCRIFTMSSNQKDTKEETCVCLSAKDVCVCDLE